MESRTGLARGAIIPIYLAIYDSTLKDLIKLARGSTEETHQTRLRRELERLFFWAESLSMSALDSKLDVTLIKSLELHETITFILGELESVLAKCLVEGAMAGSIEEKDLADIISDISVHIHCLMDLSLAI